MTTIDNPALEDADGVNNPDVVREQIAAFDAENPAPDTSAQEQIGRAHV